jgi:hypothetical protein
MLSKAGKHCTNMIRYSGFDNRKATAMKRTGFDYLTVARAAKAGRKIILPCWNNWSLEMRDDGQLYFCGSDRLANLTIALQLRTDWEIVPEQPKTMTFWDAVAHMKEGKKVGRLRWGSVCRMFLVDDGVFRFERQGTDKEWRKDKYGVPLKTEWFDATDWYVVEEDGE